MAEVTEADRKAANSYLSPAKERTIDGLAEAFAAHREAAEKAERQAVVDWLNAENGLCDCFAREENECACGAWDDCKTKPLLDIADAIARGDHRKG